MAGCGSFVRLSYNNADWAIRYFANDYLDLSGEQNELLRERIQRYHAWHRQAELPQYIELIEELSRRLRAGMTHADVVWASESLRGRYRLLLSRAIDDLAPILDRLTAENLVALERKLVESNDKFRREYEIGDRTRHRQERLKVIATRYREWLGELSAEQEARLERHVAESPDLYAELLEERKRRHAAVLAALRDAIPSLAAHGERARRGATCEDAVSQAAASVANAGASSEANAAAKTGAKSGPNAGAKTEANTGAGTGASTVATITGNAEAECGSLRVRDASADARSARAAARLKGLLVTYERHRAPGYQRVATDWEGRSQQLFLDIERSLSAKQRAHLLERLAYYAGELRLLAAR
jgi:hypothetical protein